MALTISVSDIVQASRSPLLAIRNHWSRVRIGDIGEVLNGAPFKSELFSRDTGVPLIRIRKRRNKHKIYWGVRSAISD